MIVAGSRGLVFARKHQDHIFKLYSHIAIADYLFSRSPSNSCNGQSQRPRCDHSAGVHSSSCLHTARLFICFVSKPCPRPSARPCPSLAPPPGGASVGAPTCAPLRPTARGRGTLAGELTAVTEQNNINSHGSHSFFQCFRGRYNKEINTKWL